MTQIGKGIVALSTVSALGGVGAYAGGLFDKSKPTTKVSGQSSIITTKNKLEKEGFEILSTDKDGTDWKTILDAYLQAKTKPFSNITDATKDQQKFREECEKQLNLQTEASYKIARQWCVKEKSINDILEKNYTFLDSKQDKEGERSAWSNKVETLRNSKKTEFKPWKDLMKNTDDDIATLKGECGKLDPKTIKTTSETFNDVFDKIKEFCSIRK